jgi:hypothetical protein
MRYSTSYADPYLKMRKHLCFHYCKFLAQPSTTTPETHLRQTYFLDFTFLLSYDYKHAVIDQLKRMVCLTTKDSTPPPPPPRLQPTARMPTTANLIILHAVSGKTFVTQGLHAMNSRGTPIYVASFCDAESAAFIF